jgi:hypothetical protein
MKSANFPRSRKFYCKLLTCVCDCMFDCYYSSSSCHQRQERFFSMQQCSALTGGPTCVLVSSLSGSCIDRWKVLRSAHTVYLCVLCGSENKQRLFPYTTLTDCFI